MDPSILNSDDWLQRIQALWIMWACLFFAVTAAISLIFAHAVIPSAVDSGTISSRFNKFRLPLYVVGIISFLADIVLLLYAIGLSVGFISEMYPRFWQ